VIQDQEVGRLGSNRTFKVDVRIVAATNTNLDDAIEQGNFRRDLYFRLNVIPIKLPSLRERRGDVRLLAQHFLERFNRLLNREIRGLTTKAIETLERYPWPGNIRELENLIERLVVLGRDAEPISYEDLPLDILLDSNLMTETPPLGDGLLQARDNFEKQYILKALKKAEWNQSEAARILRIHRNTLIQKMKSLAIREASPPTSQK
jgi:transcriptional regulator with PAS, ATPase and Fis domain